MDARNRVIKADTLTLHQHSEGHVDPMPIQESFCPIIIFLDSHANDFILIMLRLFKQPHRAHVTTHDGFKECSYYYY